MRTIELYRKHKAGDISREQFLYEVRRDTNIPWILNTTSYDDAVKILKNKGIISEDNSTLTKGIGAANKPSTIKMAEEWDSPYDGGQDDLDAMARDANAKSKIPVITKAERHPLPALKNRIILTLSNGEKVSVPDNELEGIYGGDVNDLDYYVGQEWDQEPYVDTNTGEVRENKVKTLKEAKKAKKTDDPNQIHPYEYRLGIQCELENLDDYSAEGLDKAKAKVLKNLNKDFNYYTNLLNAKTSPFTFKDSETNKPGMQANADGTLKKGAGKNEKANVQDTQGKKEAATKKPAGVKEFTQTPKKAAGIKKVMDIPGKEKTIKEGISFMDFFLAENEYKGEYMFVGSLKKDELDRLKHIVPDLEIDAEDSQAMSEPGQVDRTVIKSKFYNTKFLQQAVDTAINPPAPSMPQDSGVGVAQWLNKKESKVADIANKIKKEISTAKTTDAAHNQEVQMKINQIPNSDAKKRIQKDFQSGKAIDL